MRRRRRRYKNGRRATARDSHGRAARFVLLPPVVRVCRSKSRLRRSRRRRGAGRIEKENGWRRNGRGSAAADSSKFIDPASLEGDRSDDNTNTNINKSGGGGGGEGGNETGEGKGSGKGKNINGNSNSNNEKNSGPLPLPSALESEALAQVSEEEKKRQDIAAQFLEEAAKFGVSTEFMCPHAVAIGHGWAVVTVLSQLCEAVFAHLGVQTRPPEHAKALEADEIATEIAPCVTTTTKKKIG